MNKLWELGSEPTSGWLMVRMSCLQNCTVRHLCNIFQKANEEHFRTAVHWCKHCDSDCDGRGWEYTWVQCWHGLHSTLPVPRLEDCCRIRWQAFHGWQKQHLPANPGWRCLSWDQIQLLTFHLHTASLQIWALLQNAKCAKVIESLCRSLFTFYLLWPLVMPCHTCWWRTPPNFPATRKKTSLSGWHQVFLRRTMAYILYFVWRRIVSLVAPFVILWCQAAILGVACERTEIAELLVTHVATLSNWLAPFQNGFSWHCRLAHGCEGFSQLRQVFGMAPYKWAINCCVFGLHENVWNKILQAFCNCKGRVKLLWNLQSGELHGLQGHKLLGSQFPLGSENLIGRRTKAQRHRN